VFVCVWLVTERVCVWESDRQRQRAGVHISCLWPMRFLCLWLMMIECLVTLLRKTLSHEREGERKRSREWWTRNSSIMSVANERERQRERERDKARRSYVLTSTGVVLVPFLTSLSLSHTHSLSQKRASFAGWQ